MTLLIETEQKGNTTVIRCNGNITAENSMDLEDCIKDLMMRDKYSLVFDLSKADLISSSGWGVFVFFKNQLKEKSGNLCLASLNKEAEEIFNLLNLNVFISHYNTVDEAVRAF